MVAVTADAVSLIGARLANYRCKWLPIRSWSTKEEQEVRLAADDEHQMSTAISIDAGP